MAFIYSICYPDNENTAFFNTPISGNEVLSIAKNYDWINQIKLTETLDQKDIFYCPSIDFKCLDDQRSFCLTADLNEKKELEFSLWYNRPKKVKILFGLLGEIEKMRVDDVWQYSFEEAIKYLQHFVNKNYQVIEELYK